MFRGIANVVRDVAVRVVLNVADAVTGSVFRVIEGAEVERERERERERDWEAREERDDEGWEEEDEEWVGGDERRGEEGEGAEDEEDDEGWGDDEDEEDEGIGDDWPDNVEFYDGYVPSWVKPEWFRGTFFFKSDVIDYVSDIPVLVIVCRVGNVYYVYVADSDRNDDD